MEVPWGSDGNADSASSAMLTYFSLTFLAGHT